MRPHLHMTYWHVPACLPCRRLFFFSRAHFTTACLAPKSKAFQSYEATWGIAPHCYCPTLPSEPTHLHLHHPTQNSDSDSHTPVLHSPSYVYRRSPQQSDRRQIARLNDPRLQGLSCAAGDGQCREQTRRRVASIPERPDEMYEIPIRNNMRQSVR